ncbi:MAG: hypothetical protein OXF04_01165 [bacterium]|nr:hypothetical protein [bacterium]
MRVSALLASAAAFSAVVLGPGSASGWQQQNEGASVDADDGQVNIGVWIEVDIPGASESDPGPDDSSAPPCYFRQGDYTELNAWLENDFVIAPAPDEVYILKFCDAGGATRLVTYWVYQLTGPEEPPAPTVRETTRLRNEAWGRMAIPEPVTLMAPGQVTLVHLPTYVWVPDGYRAPVTETVTTTLDGHELTLTATASPRRLGFLRIDMGDGHTLWCDADDVVAFDHARDPLDQPSKCVHYYRQSSVNQPDLRYRVALTAYWQVSVVCEFDGRPCANPPPAVPTQALAALPRLIAVAEIQALASPAIQQARLTAGRSAGLSLAAGLS